MKHRFIARACGFALAISGFQLTYSVVMAGDWEKEANRGYFQVFNLDVGEELQLRAGPSFGAKAMKQLKNGDIVSSDGTAQCGSDISWREISTDLIDGWVPQRFLKRARLRVVAGTDLPVAGSCLGFSPAWKLDWDNELAHLSLFPGEAQLQVKTAITTDERRAALLIANSPGLSMQLVHTGAVCALASGGPKVGSAGYLVLTDQTTQRFYAGCCEASEAAFDK